MVQTLADQLNLDASDLPKRKFWLYARSWYGGSPDCCGSCLSHGEHVVATSPEFGPPSLDQYSWLLRCLKRRESTVYPTVLTTWSKWCEALTFPRKVRRTAHPIVHQAWRRNSNQASASSDWRAPCRCHWRPHVPYLSPRWSPAASQRAGSGR